MTELVLEVKDTTDLQVILYILDKFGVTVKQKQVVSAPILNEEINPANLSNSDNSNKVNQKLGRLLSFINERSKTVTKVEIPSRDERNQR